MPSGKSQNATDAEIAAAIAAASQAKPEKPRGRTCMSCRETGCDPDEIAFYGECLACSHKPSRPRHSGILAIELAEIQYHGGRFNTGEW